MSGQLQNKIDGQNPVLLNDEDENAVYENEEFEPMDLAAQNNYTSNSNTAHNSMLQNNTFYAGQNSKFFDKRILASQK